MKALNIGTTDLVSARTIFFSDFILLNNRKTRKHLRSRITVAPGKSATTCGFTHGFTNRYFAHHLCLFISLIALSFSLTLTLFISPLSLSHTHVHTHTHSHTHQRHEGHSHDKQIKPIPRVFDERPKQCGKHVHTKFCRSLIRQTSNK
jgi:hypothetical protein